MLSDYSMSSFHEDIAGLVHIFNMEIPIENFSSVLLGIFLEEISLNFSHQDSSTENIFSGDKANGDTFKGLFLTVNFLKSLICKYNSGWLDDTVFTFFATIFNFFKRYNVSGEFNDNLPSLVFENTQDNFLRVNPCFCKFIFDYLIKNPYKTKTKITMVQQKVLLLGMKLQQNVPAGLYQCLNKKKGYAGDYSQSPQT